MVSQGPLPSARITSSMSVGSVIHGDDAGGDRTTTEPMVSTAARDSIVARDIAAAGATAAGVVVGMVAAGDLKWRASALHFFDRDR